MTDDPLTVPQERRNASKHDPQRRISGKVRAAIEQMVWRGLDRAKAAEVAGLKDNSLYSALRRPDVKSFYLSEVEVLRVSGRARRIHRLGEIAENSKNDMAAVQAIRAAESLGDEQTNQPNNVTPGIVIRVLQVNAAATPVQHSVDVTPFAPFVTPQPAKPEPEPEPALPSDPIFHLP